jgi:hypothetical protein
MQQMVNGVTTATFVLALAASAWAKPATVTGQVMDEGCSMSMLNHGASADHADHNGSGGGDHADHQMPMPMGNMAQMTECAKMCAKNGEPMALITDDGKVYRITGGLAANKNAKLIPHVGHTVKITGEITEKDGKTEIAANELAMVKK